MGLHLLQEELKLDPVNNASCLETLEMMREASQFMSDTLNDVLSIQKIEEGKLEICPKPFHLADIVKSVSLSLKGQIDSKNLVFSTHIAKDCPVVIVGDRSRIEHVLANLVSNAIKFSAPGTKIEVKATYGDYKQGCVTVAVHDQGVGISAENLSKLFKNYMQIDPEKQQGGRGTGVGLVICKEIIEMHNGEIGCTSKLRVGDDVTSGGSIFYFTVPFPVAEDTGIADTSILSSDLVDETTKSELIQSTAPSATITQPASTPEDVRPVVQSAVAAVAAPKFAMKDFNVLIVDGLFRCIFSKKILHWLFRCHFQS